jgi:hypothetical protein
MYIDVNLIPLAMHQSLDTAMNNIHMYKDQCDIHVFHFIGRYCQRVNVSKLNTYLSCKKCPEIINNRLPIFGGRLASSTQRMFTLIGRRSIVSTTNFRDPKLKLCMYVCKCLNGFVRD